MTIFISRLAPFQSLSAALGAGLVLLIAAVTLYPFTGWRFTGAAPWSFVLAGWPRFWTWFDVLSNVAAYLVLGALLTMGGRGRGWAAWAAALSCAALSLFLEACQTYLPSRVPSLLDWCANSLGAASGAGIVFGLTRIRGWRHEPVASASASPAWFEQGPASGWVLLAWWLVCQALPQRMLFATGRFDDWLAWADGGGALAHWRHAAWGGAVVPGYGVGLEAAAVVCAMLAVGSVVLAVLQTRALRGRALLAVAGLAFALRSWATQKVYGEDAPLAWLSPGAQGGLVVGAVLLYGLASLNERTRARCAALAVLLGTVLVNLTPEDGYFQSTAVGIQWGPLGNARGLLDGLAAAWPLAAWVWLLWQSRRVPMAVRVP